MEVADPTASGGAGAGVAMTQQYLSCARFMLRWHEVKQLAGSPGAGQPVFNYSCFGGILVFCFTM
jgi:hypothetical protein